MVVRGHLGGLVADVLVISLKTMNETRFLFSLVFSFFFSLVNPYVSSPSLSRSHVSCPLTFTLLRILFSVSLALDHESVSRAKPIHAMSDLVRINPSVFVRMMNCS